MIDDIINAVNTIVYQALDAIEDGLLNVPPAQLGFKSSTTLKDTASSSEIADRARDEIENGVHQLETLLESTVDKSFDKFEIYTLRNILTVPEDLGRWIRPGHYEVSFSLLPSNSSQRSRRTVVLISSPQSQGLQIPSPESAATPESILDLRRKVQETTRLNLALRNRHAKNTALTSQLRTMLTSTPANSDGKGPKSLAFLTQSQPGGSSTSQTPLTTQTQFATSQLPALKQMVGDLRPKLDNLKGLRTGNVDWGSKKQERRQYIESGVRRVVGKGGFGSGEGGLGGVVGERRGREDVEGLEAVVGVLNREEKMES